MRCLLALGFLCGGAALAAPKAFPGAEGFGTATPGGRGGKVLLVTNLNDAGPNSFRAACETQGPRIIVFRVAGIIELKTPVKIREPFLTIAGQSAPGGGICIRGRAVEVDSHDVVIRHIRVRPGDIAGVETDAISVGGESRNVVIDHCSASWGIDENLSPSGGIADVTVQWCIISEGLNRSVHHKGAHGYGSLVRAVGGVSLHHNLWAHNRDRNPRLGDNYGKPPYPTIDVRNNVMYNFGALSIIGEILKVNYIGNYIKPGPDARSEGGWLRPNEQAKPEFYFEDNFVAGPPRKLLSRQIPLADRPFDAAPVKTAGAAQALEIVLAEAGATLPERDAVDRRVVAEVRQGGGRIIDSQWEVGGWPQYRAARPPADKDRDGMPDDWEKARGLNPSDPSDAAGDRDGDGYTNIEEYLIGLAAASKLKAQ